MVIYYDGDSWITEEDVADLYDAFRRRGWSRDEPQEKLLVLLHTYGGNADASYRLAQVIRDFAKDVTFLIPFHATSGGTLMCLCANKILLGAYATLGAIDVTIGDVPLASIEYFAKFVIDARQEFENRFANYQNEIETDMDARMMVEMVSQVGSLDIGNLYRQSNLTLLYSYKLMSEYMFADVPNKVDLARNIANTLLHRLPAHDFALDYHMCKELKIPVFEMNEELSEMTKKLIDVLHEQSEMGIICRDLPMIDQTANKAPFLRLYEGQRNERQQRRR
ncbi:SDH family Clp fold serine proteinase [Nitrososphaera sp.]|uniref:SDH family Clp fold serine proteinase n=1 Tax=Nitrososphaera sp. TaxID=1971748 RepID=UPI0031737582